MKNIIKDIKIYSKGSILRGICTIFINSCFQSMLNYRIANFLYRKLKLTMLSKIIMYFNKIIFNMDIDYRATIAGGVKLCHGLGIVIGKDVIIEDGVSIYQGVTLGGNSGKSKIWNGIEITQPVILKGASIYAGAIIIGPVVIGEKSVVGARTVITKDIPSEATVIGKNEIQIVHGKVENVEK